MKNIILIKEVSQYYKTWFASLQKLRKNTWALILYVLKTKLVCLIYVTSNH